MGPWMIATSRMLVPESANAVDIEHTFVRYKPEILEDCLRYEHTVKWIAVGTRQCSSCFCMTQADREGQKSLLSKRTREVAHETFCRGQLSQPDFSRELPG